jgi:hypothetical protein
MEEEEFEETEWIEDTYDCDDHDSCDHESIIEDFEEEVVEEWEEVSVASSSRQLAQRPPNIGISLASVDEELMMESDEHKQDTTKGQMRRDSSETIDFSIDNSASVEFDLGSYQEDISLSTEDEPEDLAQACRDLIAILHQGKGKETDAEDMIGRCDVHLLYMHLKQQHKHMLRKSSNLLDHTPEEGDIAWESFDQTDTMFAGGLFTFDNPNLSEKDPSGGDNAAGGNSFDDDSGSETDSESDENWGFSQPPQSGTTNDLEFDTANQLPKSLDAPNMLPKSAAVGTDEPTAVSLEEDDNEADANEFTDAEPEEEEESQIERRIDPDPDDPDHYKSACRRLVDIIYKTFRRICGKRKIKRDTSGNRWLLRSFLFDTSKLNLDSSKLKSKGELKASIVD